jgi:hypothetical protein
MKHAYFRGAAVTAVGFLGATVLAIAPAQATSPYTTSNLHQAAHAPTCSGYSVSGTTGTTGPGDIALTPNVTTHSSWSGSTTQANTTTTSDTVTEQYSMTSSALDTTNGALPKSLSLTYSGSYAVSAVGATSCSLNPNVYAVNNFEFTTTKPLIVTMSYHKTGQSYTEVYIQNWNSTTSYEDLYGQDLGSSASATVYLPAGHYHGYLEGDVYRQYVTTPAGTTTTLTASGSAHMSFAVPGSATSGPSGKASTYVSMAHSLSCSAHSLRTTVTKTSSSASQISKAVYSVNGHVTKTVYAKSIKPGLAISVGSLSGTATNKVSVTVYLKNGTHLSEAATYAPCTV